MDSSNSASLGACLSGGCRCHSTSGWTHAASRAAHQSAGLARHCVALAIVLNKFVDQHEATALLDHELISDDLGEDLLVAQHVVAVAQRPHVDVIIRLV